eukprot:7289771-Karenia_brevis.AAC.1
MNEGGSCSENDCNSHGVAKHDWVGFAQHILNKRGGEHRGACDQLHCAGYEYEYACSTPKVWRADGRRRVQVSRPGKQQSM